MISASVIGWPIAHSRSPLIHGYWLSELGIDGTYTKEAVEPQNLKTFIDSLRDGTRVGVNVTIPHKEAALAHVDEPDDRVRRTGALNTIWREGQKLHATSTDGQGFMANLEQQLPDFDITAGPILILGAGGSTRALVDELLRQGGSHIGIYNRTPTKAHMIAEHFGAGVEAIGTQDLGKAMGRCHLLINTTSAGMNGTPALDLPWETLAANAAAADIVYTPLVTDFLHQAQSRGHRTVTGLGMLLHQAVVGFEKWFGQKPVVTKTLHDIIARDIDQGFQP